MTDVYRFDLQAKNHHDWMDQRGALRKALGYFEYGNYVDKRNTFVGNGQ